MCAGSIIGIQFPVSIHYTPSTVMLPECWRRFEEWYDSHARPSGVEVLTTTDEESYTGATFSKLLDGIQCAAGLQPDQPKR